MRLSTTFHSQTDGQVKRTIQTFEDIFWASIIDFIGNWNKHLPLVEFAYNNGFHLSISVAPYEALYGRRCSLLLYGLQWESLFLLVPI